MRSRNIKGVLNAKMCDWVESIDDDRLRALVRRDTIITGGCITSMLLGEDVKDFDIYFKTRDTAFRVAEYYAEKFNAMRRSHGIRSRVHVLTSESTNIPGDVLGDITPRRVYMYVRSDGVAAEPGINMCDVTEDVYDIDAPQLEEGERYRPVYISCNAITLTNKIQLVMRFTGVPHEIHQSYDFEHCKCYWTSHDNRLVLPPASMEAILAKQLIYTGSKYPVCSVIRTRKFIERGWNITAGEYIKMVMQVSQLDLFDVNVLADQLVGVDSAYFNDLIVQLRAQVAEDPSFQYNEPYITRIVDNLFNGRVDYV